MLIRIGSVCSYYTYTEHDVGKVAYLYIDETLGHNGKGGPSNETLTADMVEITTALSFPLLLLALLCCKSLRYPRPRPRQVYMTGSEDAVVYDWYSGKVSKFAAVNKVRRPNGFAHPIGSTP